MSVSDAKRATLQSHLQTKGSLPPMSTTWTPKVFVKPIGVVQPTYVVRGHGLGKKKKNLTRNQGVVERPGVPLGSMSWRHRPPRVDDRTYRSTDSCGKGHGLDPLLDNAHIVLAVIPIR